ncbi:YwmB family TATA-box binding protein [Paenibacillus sp. LHD-117]|uniref:YwmB family TATA-box binding protein n=1 Tax=Paenibacillus sp. LHD-117 TaxID=3071412 RepID=UPI0027DF9F11|nr:YwmB family TATA-box binding protein [Paenibacillus sp. LHD-117]MDQ6423374.1 YwmB family TATA-box binding protein [Paenibacillus sp. LHD-117]
MYVPRKSLLNLENDNVAKPKRKPPSPFKKKHGVAGASALLIVLLLIALLLNKSDPQNQAPDAEKDSHDLNQLWTWSHSLLAGGAEAADWMIRWDAVLQPDSSFSQLAAKLYANEKGEATEKFVTNEGKTIKGPFPATWDGSLSMHETETTDQGVAVIVLLETDQGIVSKEELLESTESIAAILAQHSSDWKITLKSYGFAKSADAAKELERITMGRVMEQYEDGGTRSVTLLTDKLLASQSLDGYRHANLQVAEHRNTENDRMEVTIGVPLITGDFSDVDAGAE